MTGARDGGRRSRSLGRDLFAKLFAALSELVRKVVRTLFACDYHVPRYQ